MAVSCSEDYLQTQHSTCPQHCIQRSVFTHLQAAPETQWMTVCLTCICHFDALDCLMGREQKRKKFRPLF